MRFLHQAIWFLLIFMACSDAEDVQPDFPALLEIPAGFPALVQPPDNEFSDARWALGKKLFFDPVLSRDSTISCASCHKPELAFSDSRPFSPGVENRPGTRNAPSLANVGYHPYFLREGGVPTLEMQVLVPIQEHNEFDYNIVLIGEKLKKDSIYHRMSVDAYGREPDPFVVTRAIACFERSLISGNSPYDKAIQSGDLNQLSASAQNGMNLFFSSRTNCFECHGGFNFTQYGFANNGLYAQYDDPGRMRLTGLVSDMAMFKIPGLRNVALTAPYMHDGSLATLEDVVQHYNEGGHGHPNQSPLVKPLGLSSAEINDLVSFLKTLTDESFIQNPVFYP